MLIEISKNFVLSLNISFRKKKTLFHISFVLVLMMGGVKQIVEPETSNKVGGKETCIKAYYIFYLSLLLPQHGGREWHLYLYNFFACNQKIDYDLSHLMNVSMNSVTHCSFCWILLSNTQSEKCSGKFRKMTVYSSQSWKYPLLHLHLLLLIFHFDDRNVF